MKQEERARKAAEEKASPSATAVENIVELTGKEKAIAEPIIETFQDQLKNRLKKRANADGVVPVVVEKKVEVVVNNFQDQLRNKLKKRMETTENGNIYNCFCNGIMV